MSNPCAAPLSPSTPAVSRIGRFYLTRELGRGAVGCVYLGHDPVLGRDVAIKTHNPLLTPAERSRNEQHFINEARATGLLSHPHIVTVYDASIENGAAYIAMEYLRGRELDKILASGHRFKPDDVASIAWKIADALNHAHQREVIHRDVKPANIFMVADDQPKLVDFGIARSPNRIADRNANPDNPVTILAGNCLAGTPNYMSPEQASGKEIDARTDIYSLGAVMYEMLVGRKPFHSESAEKLLQMIAAKAPPAPHEIDPRIPRALSEIVMKAMSRRPEKRYETAEKLARDIKRYLVRQRRTRRSMKISVPALEPRKRNARHLFALQNPRLWIGGVTLTAAGIVATALFFF